MNDFTGRLARASSRHPWRTLALWGVAIVLAIGAIGALLEDTLTTDAEMTNDPESYRASTGHFSWPPPTFPESEWLAPDLGAIGPNACGIPEGPRFGVGDGYWVMLRPLAPGAHVLRITASIANTIEIDVTYQLTQE